MIHTIVLDDEWYNLEEIADLIDHTGFMTVVGRFMNPIEALNEAKNLKPQVAFVDIEMPEMDGLTFSEKLRTLHPEVKIVFITSWNQYAVEAFELNALDYIMKPIGMERFMKMTEKIIKTLLPTTKTGIRGALTQREAEVLTLLAQGLTRQQIGDALFLSVSAIKRHLECIYEKLNVNNKISAVQIARDHNLI